MSLNRAAHSFITGILQTFDHHHYPAVDNVAVAEDSPPDAGKIPDEVSKLLPRDVKTIIYGHAQSISHWASMTGVFDPDMKDQDTEQSIELNAEVRLLELGQNVSPLLSKKLQLLSFIFADTFVRASEEGKQAIIDSVKPLQPRIEATYSYGKKATINITAFFVRIINNPWLKAALVFYSAYKAYVIVEMAKTFITTFIFPRVATQITSSLTNYGSLHLIKAYSLASETVDWIIHNQFRIFLYSFSTAILPQGRLRLMAIRVFNTMLIPMYAPFTIFRYSIGLAFRAGSITAKSHTLIGTSLQGMKDRARADYLQAEGEKALYIWLELAQRKNCIPIAAAAR